MIRLFNKNETNFDHNGWILSECKSAIVTETVDGIFDLDLVYSLNDSKQLSQYLVIGNIIKCPLINTDSRGEQLFRIRTRKPNTKNNEVNIYAQAIARADLMKDFVLGVEVPAGKTRKEAIGMILSNCVEHKDYYVGNLDTNTNTTVNLGIDEDTGEIINYLDIAYVSPLKAFLDDSDSAISIYNAYSGEIIFNNKEINFVDERGSDNIFDINSGKNLQELEQELSDLDSDNFATALIMCSSDGVYLPNNEIIYSPNAATLGKYYKKIVCDDVSLVDDTQEALNVVYDQLRERAQKKFNEGLDKLPINNTVNFVLLKNTEEYKNLSMLEKCELGNNVNINYYKANITATGRVTKIKYNALANNGEGKIEEIEIGDRKTNIVRIISSISSKANTANTKSDKNKAEIKKNKKDADKFKVTMEARTNNIELSVENETKNRVAAINVLDGEIQERVTNDTFESYRKQTAEEIDQMVKEDDFSTLIKQNSRSVAIAIKDETETNIIFDSDGQTIKNGALKVYDEDDNLIFYFTTSGHAIVGDIEVKNTGSSSDFYRTLRNMREIYLADSGDVILNNLHASDIYVNSNSLHISGKTLYAFIEDVLKDYDLI